MGPGIVRSRTMVFSSRLPVEAEDLYVICLSPQVFHQSFHSPSVTSKFCTRHLHYCFFCLSLLQQGILYELFPLILMIPMPCLPGSSFSRRNILEGKAHLPCLLLAFCLFPFDVYYLHIASAVLPHDMVKRTRMAAAMDNGGTFHEDSVSLAMKRWQHRRSVEPSADGGFGCVVRDEVTIHPRWTCLAALYAGLVGCLFRWRHNRLRARYGAATPFRSRLGERN